MKKQLLNVCVAFAATMLFAGSVLAQHEAPTKTMDVPKLQAGDAIVVDGTADEDSWSAKSDVLGKFNVAGVTSDADFSGSIKLCYDANNLYLFVDIVDDVETSYAGTGDTYTFDCVEFFQDLDTLSPTPATGAYSNTATDDAIQGRFNRSWDTYTGTVGRNAAEYTYAYISGGAGWTVEASLPWVGQMPEGNVLEDLNAFVEKGLGFDIQIADNDGSGRDGQFAWDADDEAAGTTEDNAWKDTRTFGVIHLLNFTTDVKPVENSVFGVYPNPANSVVNFDNLNGVTSIEIVNMIGQVVKHINVDATNVSLNVSDLTSGSYFAKIYTNAGISTEQFLVK